MQRFLIALGIAGLLLPAPVTRADAPAANAADVPANMLPADMPPKMRQRLEKMPPDQRRKIVQQWRQFQKLPPEARNALQNNYQAFSKMTPEQREQLRRQYQQFESMSPEQKQKCLENLKRWQHLSREQQDKLRSQMRAKKHANPAVTQNPPQTNAAIQATPAAASSAP